MVRLKAKAWLTRRPLLGSPESGESPTPIYLSVKDKAYIGVACQGPCLVLTSEIFSPNQSIAAGTPVTLGAVDGIPAKLLVYDNPYSQVLI